jgi:hypothetical protein
MYKNEARGTEIVGGSKSGRFSLSLAGNSSPIASKRRALGPTEDYSPGGASSWARGRGALAGGGARGWRGQSPRSDSGSEKLNSEQPATLPKTSLAEVGPGLGLRSLRSGAAAGWRAACGVRGAGRGGVWR